MSPTHTPTLVRRRTVETEAPHWEPAAQRVLAGVPGMLRLLGGPGTGKTTLLAHAAADRVHADADSAERVLVLTGSRRAATAMRSQISALLAAKQPDGAGPRTVREPLVRTVHSYAFAVLRRQAAMHELPPPRLLSGPEQDAVVRELLAGDIEFGARYWPARLRAALAVPGFADELRDLMLRAAERGLGPEHLIDFGKRHGREEWVAAGKFARQYEQVTLLQGAVGAESPQATAPALDAAELVASALLALDTDAALLRQERDRVRYLFIDDVQHFDPLQFKLARVLGESARQYVLAGDPDQSVFGFRGADPGLLAGADPAGERTVTLTRDHRMSSEVATAVQRLAARLPGLRPRQPERQPEGQQPEDDRQQGRVQVHLFASAAVEASWVADELRRAHLQEGVPWSEMAVVVRSATRALPVLRRALHSAGVPLEVPADELPLARQAAVRPFLALLRCATPPSPGKPDPLDAETAELLLCSSLGGADALAMRRLRRGLRRLELTGGGSRSSGELLVEVIRSADKLAGLEDNEAAPVRRISALLATAQSGIEAGASVEEVLWRLWQGSGLERRWSATAASGGHAGAAADRDLDAIVALFAAAARYVDRLPGASVAGFAEYLSAQQIVGDTLAATAPRSDAVTLLTAHAAAGREWTVVAVPGVAEGVWPDLRLRGTLLGVERMVDALSGVDSSAIENTVSATAPLLAEERRLLVVAASRAKHTLLLSAVRGEDEQPSRFLEELLDPEGIAAGSDVDVAPVHRPRRGLVLAELVGELRRVVCDQDADPARRNRAATQLARLAEAGVSGAHPDEWYGLPEPSTQASLWAADEPVGVSPSTLELLLRCPLRWLVERHGGAEVAETPAVSGQLVHALAQAAANGAEGHELTEALEQAWETVDAGAPWFSKVEARRLAEMLRRFTEWLRSSRAVLTEVGVERGLNVPLRGDIGTNLRLRGRVDRLETDPEGNPVIVDIKTGKTPVSKEDAANNPQLALYQLAVALGAFEDLPTTPGGARLLYLSKADRSGGATERVQPPLDEKALAQWRTAVATAAAQASGPSYTATESADCPRCPVRVSCPLQDPGRQVGE